MSRLTHWAPQAEEIKAGGWCLLGPGAAEAMGDSELDWIGLDAQHGFFDDRALREALHVIPSMRKDALVRVPSNDPAWIGRVLDAGARGVIVPMVETAAQAAQAAQATRYPPQGNRSWGQFAEAWGREEMSVEHSNATSVCAVMVETRVGLSNVNEIAATPGIDMIYVGPFDLSIALGTTVGELLSGANGELASIVNACRDHDVIPGVFAGSSERAEVLAAMGFRAITATTDIALITGGATSVHRKLRDSGMPSAAEDSHGGAQKTNLMGYA